MPKIYEENYQVVASDLDGLNHVNNKVYLNWMESIAWQHSLAVGINQATQQKTGKLMIVKQHQLNYISSAKLNDKLILTTWVDKPAGCCQRKRHYQFFRKTDTDKQIIFEAHSIWVCVDINTHKPAKFPEVFISAYL
jgi:acyl-CoA thioester hydrolase